MVQLMKIESVGDVRTFTNSKGEQSCAVDIELLEGPNLYICTAFDKIATIIKGGGFAKGVLVLVDLHFSVSGTEKKFQNVRLNSITIL